MPGDDKLKINVSRSVDALRSNGYDDATIRAGLIKKGADPAEVDLGLRKQNGATTPVDILFGRVPVRQEPVKAEAPPSNLAQYGIASNTELGRVLVDFTTPKLEELPVLQGMGKMSGVSIKPVQQANTLQQKPLGSDPYGISTVGEGLFNFTVNFAAAIPNFVSAVAKGVVNTPSFLLDAVGGLGQLTNPAAVFAPGAKSPVKAATDYVNGNIVAQAAKYAESGIDYVLPYIDPPIKSEPGKWDAAAWGSALGQAAAQIGAVAATQGRSAVPYLTNFFGAYGMSLEDARKSGLPDDDARLMAGSIALITSWMDVNFGVENVVAAMSRNAATKPFVSEAVGKAVAEITEKGMTKGLLKEAALVYSESIQEAIKKAGMIAIEQGLKEGADETVQGVLESAAKTLYNYAQPSNEKVGTGKFEDVYSLRAEDIPAGRTDLQPGFQGQTAWQNIFEGLIGGVTGGTVGAIGPLATRTGFAKDLFGEMARAENLGRGTEYAIELGKTVDASAANGTITREQAQMTKQDLATMQRTLRLTSHMTDPTGDLRMTYFDALRGANDAKDYIRRTLSRAAEVAQSEADIDIIASDPVFRKAIQTVELLEGATLAPLTVKNDYGIAIPGITSIQDGNVNIGFERKQPGLLAQRAVQNKAMTNWRSMIGLSPDEITAMQYREEAEKPTVEEAVEKGTPTETTEVVEEETSPATEIAAERPVIPEKISSKLTPISQEIDEVVKIGNRINEYTGQEPDYASAVQDANERLNRIRTSFAKFKKTLVGKVFDLALSAKEDWAIDLNNRMDALPRTIEAKAVESKTPPVAEVVIEEVAATPQPEAGAVLNTLNPTGSVFAEYAPEQRDDLPLGENITTFDKTAGVNPDTKIVVYRGVSKGVNKIKSGDFVTTNKQLAEDYAGEGRVISLKVRADEILDDSTEPLGEEYILRLRKETPPAKEVIAEYGQESSPISEIRQLLERNNPGEIAQLKEEVGNFDVPTALEIIQTVEDELNSRTAAKDLDVNIQPEPEAEIGDPGISPTTERVVGGDENINVGESEAAEVAETEEPEASADEAAGVVLMPSEILLLKTAKQKHPNLDEAIVLIEANKLAKEEGVPRSVAHTIFAMQKLYYPKEEKAWTTLAEVKQRTSQLDTQNPRTDVERIAVGDYAVVQYDGKRPQGFVIATDGSLVQIGYMTNDGAEVLITPTWFSRTSVEMFMNPKPQSESAIPFTEAEKVKEAVQEPPAPNVTKQIVSEVRATKTNARVVKQVTAQLSKAFPKVRVVSDIAQIDAVLSQLAEQGLKPIYTVAGFVHNGVIYIDPRVANPSTPIHEYAHIWVSAIRESMPTIYAEGKKQALNSPYREYVESLYADQIEQMREGGATQEEIGNFVAEEALATAIGEQGAKMVGTTYSRFRSWLTNMWQRIKSMFGKDTMIAELTADEIEGMTFDQFSKAVAKRLLNGSKIIFEGNGTPPAVDVDVVVNSATLLPEAQQLAANGEDYAHTGWELKDGLWEQTGKAEYSKSVFQTFQTTDGIAESQVRKTNAASATKFQLLPGTSDNDMILDEALFPTNTETAAFNSVRGIVGWMTDNIEGVPVDEAALNIQNAFRRWVNASQQITQDKFESRAKSAGLHGKSWADFYAGFNDLSVMKDVAAFASDPEGFELAPGREKVTLIIAGQPKEIPNPYRKIAGILFGGSKIDGIPNTESLFEGYAKFHRSNFTHTTSGQRMWTRLPGNNSAIVRTVTSMRQRAEATTRAGRFQNFIRKNLQGVFNLHTIGMAYFAPNSYGREVFTNKVYESLKKYAPIFEKGSVTLQRVADACDHITVYRGRNTWATVDKMTFPALEWNKETERFQPAEIEIPVSEAISLVMIYDTQMASYGKSSLIVRDRNRASGAAYQKHYGNKKAEVEHSYFIFESSEEIEAIRDRIMNNPEYKAAYDAVKQGFNDPERFTAVADLYAKIVGQPLQQVTGANGAGEYFRLVAVTTAPDTIASATGGNTAFIDRISILNQRIGAGEAVLLTDAVGHLHRYLAKTDEFLKNGEHVFNLAIFADDIKVHIAGQSGLQEEGAKLLEAIERHIEALNDYNKYLATYIKTGGDVGKVINALTRNFAIARFALSFGVPLKQSVGFTGSLGLGIVDDKYILAELPWLTKETASSMVSQFNLSNIGPRNTGSRIERTVGQRSFYDTIEEVKQYPEAAEIFNRITGLYTADTEFVSTMRHIISSGIDQESGVVEHLRKLSDEYGMYATRRVDRAVILAQYRAARAEALANAGVDNVAALTQAQRTEMFDKAVRLMYATNVMYDVATRTTQQLDKSFIGQILGLFSGQSQRMLNTVAQAWYDWHDGVPGGRARFFASAGTMVVVNAIAISFINMLVSAFRKTLCGVVGGNAKKDLDLTTNQRLVDFVINTVENVIQMRPGLSASTAEAILSQIDNAPYTSKVGDNVGVEQFNKTVEIVANVFNEAAKEHKRPDLLKSVENSLLLTAETLGVLPSEIKRITACMLKAN